MYHHAVGTLLLDHRLGDTQLIHPVAQRDKVLLHCGFLDALFGFRLERDEQVVFLILVLLVQQVVGKTLLDLVLALAARLCIAELHRQYPAVASHARIRDILFAQSAAYVADGRIQRFVQRGFHVHLQQKMHPAA